MAFVFKVRNGGVWHNAGEEEGIFRFHIKPKTMPTVQSLFSPNG